MMEILTALENSGWSMWIKEASAVYVAILAFHTIGLTFLVGISTTISLRILGIVRSIPLQPMADFFPLMYAGAVINVLTGLVLITLYPTDYVVDASFYIKMTAIVAAIITLRGLRAHVFDDGSTLNTQQGIQKAKRLAALLPMFWLIATFTGRVIAYGIETKIQTGAAFVVFLIIALVIWNIIGRPGWSKAPENSL